MGVTGKRLKKRMMAEGFSRDEAEAIRKARGIQFFGHEATNADKFWIFWGWIHKIPMAEITGIKKEEE